jgi:Putative lumazine-binding
VEAATETGIGPAPDRDEILRVVHLYIDGFGAHRPEMFAQAFHSAARIYWTDAEGTFREALILNPDNDPDDPGSWPNLDQWRVTGRIISVIQAGDVASVVLGFDNNDDPAQSWVDIHTLLRVDGSWKIMAKTATHASRGDWAGLGVGESRNPRPTEQA